jgi:hypothetical protein
MVVCDLNRHRDIDGLLSPGPNNRRKPPPPPSISEGESGIASCAVSFTFEAAFDFALPATSSALSATFEPPAPASFSATKGSATNAAPAAASPAGLLSGPSPFDAFWAACFAPLPTLLLIFSSSIAISPSRFLSLRISAPSYAGQRARAQPSPRRSRR